MVADASVDDNCAKTQCCYGGLLPHACISGSRRGRLPIPLCCGEKKSLLTGTVLCPLVTVTNLLFTASQFPKDFIRPLLMCHV